MPNGSPSGSRTSSSSDPSSTSSYWTWSSIPTYGDGESRPRARSPLADRHPPASDHDAGGPKRVVDWRYDRCGDRRRVHRAARAGVPVPSSLAAPSAGRRQDAGRGPARRCTGAVEARAMAPEALQRIPQGDEQERRGRTARTQQAARLSRGVALGGASAALGGLDLAVLRWRRRHEPVEQLGRGAGYLLDRKRERLLICPRGLVEPADLAGSASFSSSPRSSSRGCRATPSAAS